MATFDTVQPQPFGTFTISDVKTFVEKNLESFATWKKIRAEKAELYALTNAELDDIGVKRCDIESLFKA